MSHHLAGDRVLTGVRNPTDGWATRRPHLGSTRAAGSTPAAEPMGGVIPSRRNASRRKAARSGENWSPGLLRPGSRQFTRRRPGDSSAFAAGEPACRTARGARPAARRVRRACAPCTGIVDVDDLVRLAEARDRVRDRGDREQRRPPRRTARAARSYSSASSHASLRKIRNAPPATVNQPVALFVNPTNCDRCSTVSTPIVASRKSPAALRVLVDRDRRQQPPPPRDRRRVLDVALDLLETLAVHLLVAQLDRALQQGSRDQQPGADEAGPVDEDVHGIHRLSRGCRPATSWRTPSARRPSVTSRCARVVSSLARSGLAAS